MDPERLRELVKTYFTQFTKGCGASVCSNPKCASNPNVEPMVPNAAAAAAVKLAMEAGDGEICVVPMESEPASPAVSHPIEAAVEQPTSSDVTMEVDAAHAVKEEREETESELEADTSNTNKMETDQKVEAAKSETESKETEAKPGAAAAAAAAEPTETTETVFTLKDWQELIEEGDTRKIGTEMYRQFSRPETLNEMFKVEGDELAVDTAAARETLTRLIDVNESTKKGIVYALRALTQEFEQTLLYRSATLTPKDIRQYVIMFENPLLEDMENYDNIVPELCTVTSLLPDSLKEELMKVWVTLSLERFRHMVSMLQQFLTIHILDKTFDGYVVNFDKAVTHGTHVLEIFSKTNSRRPKEQQLPRSEFWNDAINESIDFAEDFQIWKGMESGKPARDHISFIQHPFVLSMATRAKVVMMENKWLQSRERRHSMLEALFMGSSVFLKLTINREHVVRDAITQLSSIEHSDPDRLKKQLRITFVGEEGIDEGGVQKEFFQLVMKDLFDPNYGMFTYDDETKLYWFNQNSLETPIEFKLLGVLLGVALYNNVILDLHFPRVVFKKLMGHDVSLDDMEELHPSLTNGLRQLLKYDGDDLAEVFEYKFYIESEDFYGNKHTHELKEGGKDIDLTKENREEFVQLYVDWILNKSVATQFDAFKAGFHLVAAGTEALTLFQADEIELLLCGQQDLDLDALEGHTRYDGGYSKDHPVVKWFWKTVKQFSDEEKKLLLKFSTGTDRAPVGGLGTLNFIIVKQGADSERLPTSHTCFNALMLPEYSNEEKLKDLLKKAIQHCEGFGML